MRPPYPLKPYSLPTFDDPVEATALVAQRVAGVWGHAAFARAQRPEVLGRPRGHVGEELLLMECNALVRWRGSGWVRDGWAWLLARRRWGRVVGWMDG